MMKCKKCGSYNIVIHTETRFGQGDSEHVCYGKCHECGNTSASVIDHAIFEITTFRKAQDNWIEENK